MTELEKARQRIDEADAAIAAAFEKRMAAVKTVAGYKSEHGLPVFDEAREKAVIARGAARLENKELTGGFETLLQTMMDVSKSYQEKLMHGMRAAYGGTEGSFAEKAAKKIFPGAAAASYPDFVSAYRAVLDNAADCCVLPLENSYAGEVGQVTDLLFDGPLTVSGIYEMPVRQALLGVPGAVPGQIKTVLSHPQALAQCAGYIREHGFVCEQTANTAFAAKQVARMNDPTVAAIASSEAARLYGLTVLAEHVGESAVNTTRFAVLSKNPAPSGTNDSFLLLFTVNDEVGALAKAVNVISAHGFNMRVLRSRPVRDVPWQYYFYAELTGDPESEEGRKMLRELSVCCEKLKTAGCYSAGRTI